MKKLCYILAASVWLSGCSGHGKKILIYASSEIKLDDAQKKITVSEGTTHQEKEWEIPGSGDLTLSAQSPAGKFILHATGEGLYILNLQQDTVVGSFQRIGTGEGETTITQDQLKARIDSLQKLILGQNISQAGRNFFIPPGKMEKISDNTKAKVFGPYTSVPTGFDAGSVPEIFKFYTNPEVREIIEKLVPMTVNPQSQ
jgi:hypothetical protein